MSMMGSSAERAGSKRPHSSSTSEDRGSVKKRKVQRVLQHVQKRPVPVELASQDPVFAQAQLLKSIAAALVAVGFDGVKPSALEMFRSHVEEYMLHFLSHTRLSMHDGRRTQPTAQDFARALSQLPNTHSASLLKSQLDVHLPEDIAYPSIPEPDPALPPTPDFSSLLKPLMEIRSPTYVPQHFPTLPPRHAWRQTDVFPEREVDARKMREKATEEGMLAEQALRKLATAAKAGAIKAERKRSTALSGIGKTRDGPRDRRAGTRVKRDTFLDVLVDIAGTDEGTELGLEGAGGRVAEGLDLGMPEGVVVNHHMPHWRRGGGRG